MRSMRFVKMHGNGNDFVIFDEFEKTLIPEEEKPSFVKIVCNRNFGIGADGVIFVQKSKIADAKFRYFNRDGSEASMCGNGIRCFARYIVEKSYARGRKVRVETLSDIFELEVWRDEKWWIKVKMGKPFYLWKKEMKVNGKIYEVHATLVGVPHAVVFTEDISFDIIPDAKVIRHHSIFPEGTNVNFVKLMDGKIFVRTYERGVENETLSCGTGSVASAFVARNLGLISNKVEVQSKGGVLFIEFEGDEAYMIGSATKVFEGVLSEEVVF